MKFKLLAMVAVCGVFAVGCKSTGDDTSAGGSSGDGGGSGTGGSANTVTSTGNTMTTGGLPACDDSGVCDGTGTDPAADCLVCAILGDDTVATDGGACANDYVQCFGTMEDCSDAGNPACCALYDCFTACGDANPTDAAAELNCICTNDGTSCGMTQTDTATCLGNPATAAGLDDAIAFETCVFEDVCPSSCAG